MSDKIEHYRQFTGPAEHQKAVNNFLGLLAGISIDNAVDENEANELRNWYTLYRPLINRHPFNEILPVLDDILEDRIVTPDELESLQWLCHQVTSGQYYDLITSATQNLHGVLHGVLANNTLTDVEIANLQIWLADHSVLSGTYPFDEIVSLIHSITEDGVITEVERSTLKAFFSEFVDERDSVNLNNIELAELRNLYSIKGICVKDPQIIIPGSVFCFTGSSARASRDEIAKLICERGGSFGSSVTRKTQYLVVGNEGNPCWAYTCYGRKVEQAVELRKKGYPVLIVNESDFWTALEA